MSFKAPKRNWQFKKMESIEVLSQDSCEELGLFTLILHELVTFVISKSEIPLKFVKEAVKSNYF